MFGGLACSLWGMSERPVGDVDIVVFGPHDAEDIKAYIVDNHDCFSLDPSKDPGATHQILYFNLHWGLGLRCKVDILTSGRNSALQIPSIPRRYVTYLGANDDIPVVPLLVLLILKVQGWRDNSAKKKKAKILRDIRDVDTGFSKTLSS
ncbi:hypothetical protein AX14_003897 [Amanita brunnescens Koide BX004]|nr:hypothetical protein AX14_003897 [Amanita brunnescens Koide BX004]